MQSLLPKTSEETAWKICECIKDACALSGSYEAMTTGRSYKAKISSEDAIEELKREKVWILYWPPCLE